MLFFCAIRLLNVWTFAQGHISVLVTVEPEGVVAIPHVQERQSVIFNIGNLVSHSNNLPPIPTVIKYQH